jgi:hypothetical protein
MTEHLNPGDNPQSCPILPAWQYVKIGIADPTINWVDLGASRRSAKTAIGFTGYPVRCRHKTEAGLGLSCAQARRGTASRIGNT